MLFQDSGIMLLLFFVGISIVHQRVICTTLFQSASWICLIWQETKFRGKFRPPRPEIHTTRLQSANKSPQGQVQPPDSNVNTHMENNSNIDVRNAPSKNTSELPSTDTVLAGHKATSSSDQVLIGDDLASDCNLGREDRKPDGTEEHLIAEDFSSVSLSDTEPPHTSRAKDDLSTEHSREEIVFSDKNISSSLSTNVETTLAEMKLAGLTLDKPVVFTLDEESLGEDEETFLAKLHDNNEDMSQNGEPLNELSHKLGSEASNNEKIRYSPSSWTPMEVTTATGNPEKTTVEHALELKSTYSEVEAVRRSPNGACACSNTETNNAVDTRLPDSKMGKRSHCTGFRVGLL